MKLHVVPDAPAPDTPAEKVRRRLRATAKPAAMLQCHRCACRELIESKVGVLLEGGKPKGGTKALLCAGCLLRGERVVVG